MPPNKVQFDSVVIYVLTSQVLSLWRTDTTNTTNLFYENVWLRHKHPETHCDVSFLRDMKAWGRMSNIVSYIDNYSYVHTYTSLYTIHISLLEACILLTLFDAAGMVWNDVVVVMVVVSTHICQIGMFAWNLITFTKRI